MNILLWILCTIALYVGYTYAYQKYLDIFLHKDKPAFKLPTLRSFMIAWVLISFVLLLIFNASNQRYTAETCSVFNTDIEENVAFSDEETYQKGWKKYMDKAEEGEQVNVSHRQIGDGVELIVSQNKAGLIFVAVRIEREVAENEYYSVAITDKNKGGTASFTKKYEGFLGMYAIREEPLKNCDRFALDIHVYNMCEGENTDPILIDEHVEIDKAVSR